MADVKRVYTFGNKEAEGNGKMRELLGGKGANLAEMKAHYERGGLGDMKVKKFLNAVMQETLEPIRLKREKLAEDLPAIWDILFKGCKEARAAAAETLFEVRKAMKIDYFSGM